MTKEQIKLHASNNDSASLNLEKINNCIAAIKNLDTQLDNDSKKLHYWQNNANILRLTLLDLQNEINIDYRKQAKKRKLRQFPKKMVGRMKHDIKRLLFIFLKPKLGVLHQYDSKFLDIPTSYYKEKLPKNPPLISIVTPSFNQCEFLERTILSVIDQKYPNFELIIQDGGSNDGSLEIINKYSSHIKRWESKTDTGQSNALNLGFRHTNGEIMAYLNSDDIFLPGTLAYVTRYFEEHPEVDVVYGHRIIIDEYDHEIGRWVLPPHNSNVLLWADYIPQETLFWRRKIWEKVGANIDESFKFAMDWDLLLRFREAGAKFARLPRFLGGFRVHTEQKTSSQMASIGLKEMQRLRKRYLGKYMPGNEIKKNIRLYQIKHIICDSLYKIGILKY